MNHWDIREKERYQELLDQHTLKGCFILNLLAISLLPAFFFLDYYAHPQHLEALSWIRFTSTFICILALIPLMRSKDISFSFAYSVCLLAFCTVSITLFCLVQGGYRSPYYAGINLVILAAVLMIPGGPLRLSPVVGLVVTIYVLGILIKANFRIEQEEALLNNLYFIGSTVIIGLSASAFMEHTRRESFDRYLRIEKAQLDLKKSGDLLRAELKSEQKNVESLVKEITLRKTELEKALQLRDEFISMASHELNTPLTALKLQTMLARRSFSADSVLGPAALLKIVDTYEGQLQRLIRIVGDMLDISRIAAGKLELERSPVDLVEVVHQVLTLLDSGEGRIQLTTSEARLEGFWDKFKLEQVVLNLQSNALKYGGGNVVKVFIGREGNWAFLEVQDQGIGISQEAQEKIFERFERAVLRKDYPGLGLGLYISQQIVRAHGGEIKVRSELGKGSTFRVELPLETFRPS